ncbi:MAG: MerR family transcriptional regulator [Elusimicrobia bacterium]|nr:MerR family transcriptional regulator [Elusimicrobiota bacterium]
MDSYPIEKQCRADEIYSIGSAARLLRVCQATLRIWERKGLIHPRRLGKNRFYSDQDIRRLRTIKDLIQKKRLNIEGVKAVLGHPRCWEVKKCSSRQRKTCSYFVAHGETP